MHRLRSTWLALAGGAILVTLSVSTAFGAPPTEKDDPRGQKVSDFVHELVFGPDEATDEDEVVEEEPAEDDEDGSEEDEDVVDDDEDGSEEDGEDVDEDVDEDAEEGADADSARQVPEEFKNHGECVSAAVHDTVGFEESEAANHGEWVSMHARYVCWSLPVPGEEPEEEVDEDSAADEEEDADAASAREQAKADRAAARAERKAERAAARAERHAGKNKGH